MQIRGFCSKTKRERDEASHHARSRSATFPRRHRCVSSPQIPSEELVLRECERAAIYQPDPRCSGLRAPGVKERRAARRLRPSPAPNTPAPLWLHRGRKNGSESLCIRKRIIMHNKKTPALVYINTALTEYPFPNSPSGSQQQQSSILNIWLPPRPPGGSGLGRRRAEQETAVCLGKGAEPRAGGPGVRTRSGTRIKARP